MKKSLIWSIKMKIINKSMDLNDLNSDDAKEIIKELIELEQLFKKNNCHITSWYGEYNPNKYYRKLNLLNRGYDYCPIIDEELDYKYPNFLLWEIYWVVSNIKFKKGMTVLDIGGACSLFSFYLAMKGVKVIAIDLNKEIVEEANKIAEKMNLDYLAINKDALKYVNDCNLKFDVITSICVFEHIEIMKRKRIIKKMSKILKFNGQVAFTFDYKNPSKFVNINNFEDIKAQFLCNKSLVLKGNNSFYDNNINYLIHPFYRKPIFWKYKIKSIKKGNFPLWEIFRTKKENDYSFGAIFLKKQS